MEKYNPVVEHEGEKTLHVKHLNIRQSISILLFKLVLIDVISGFFVIVTHTVLFSTGQYVTFLFTENFYNMLVFIFLVIFKIILSIFIVLQWIEEHYEISPKQIVHRKGFLFKNETMYSFQDIKSIQLDQGIFGKMFNYGTISMYDWKLREHVVLYLIHNPLRYIKILEDLIPGKVEEKHYIREHFMEKEGE